MWCVGLMLFFVHYLIIIDHVVFFANKMRRVILEQSSFNAKDYYHKTKQKH